MLGSKTDALNLSWLKTRFLVLKKAPAHLLVAGVFLFSTSGCIMTRAQGDRLDSKVQTMENEMVRLQRVRHDMEVLLSQVRDMVDRIARLEGQLGTLRETLSEGSSKNTELVAEIQTLRNQLEQAQHRYSNLEHDQERLAKNQMALKEAQNKIRVPPLKEDHFALAKKYYLSQKFDEAIHLFEQFIKEYPKEDELSSQSYFMLGEIYKKLAEDEKSSAEAETYFKKSFVSYQKIIELYKDTPLREETLFKLGQVLKALGNTEGAIASFKELIAKYGKSKRIKEAKSQIAEMEKAAKK